MRKAIPLSHLDTKVKEFIIRFRIAKNYPFSEIVTIGDFIELLSGSIYAHKETSFESALYFDNIIQAHEVNIGWDGEELIDILAYVFTEYLLDRLKRQSVILE